jgi:hypothetical protein
MLYWHIYEVPGFGAFHPAQPIPVAARSKARVCGRSPAGASSSNHAAERDVCFL